MKRRERLTFFGLKKKTGKSCTIPVRCRCREGRGCRGRKAGRVGASRLRFGVSKAWTGGVIRAAISSVERAIGAILRMGRSSFFGGMAAAYLWLLAERARGRAAAPIAKAK
ncbi:MAG: hypothetical protein RL077_1284 [Verrucomicrobiota bacterium]